MQGAPRISGPPVGVGTPIGILIIVNNSSIYLISSGILLNYNFYRNHSYILNPVLIWHIVLTFGRASSLSSEVNVQTHSRHSRYLRRLTLPAIFSWSNREKLNIFIMNKLVGFSRNFSSTVTRNAIKTVTVVGGGLMGSGIAQVSWFML